MSAITRTTQAAQSTFSVLGTLVGIYALYKWLYFALVLTSAWTMAEALTWTIIALVLFAPSVAIGYLTRGD